MSSEENKDKKKKNLTTDEIIAILENVDGRKIHEILRTGKIFDADDVYHVTKDQMLRVLNAIAPGAKTSYLSNAGLAVKFKTALDAIKKKEMALSGKERASEIKKLESKIEEIEADPKLSVEEKAKKSKPFNDKLKELEADSEKKDNEAFDESAKKKDLIEQYKIDKKSIEDDKSLDDAGKKTRMDSLNTTFNSNIAKEKIAFDNDLKAGKSPALSLGGSVVDGKTITDDKGGKKILAPPSQYKVLNASFTAPKITGSDAPITLKPGYETPGGIAFSSGEMDQFYDVRIGLVKLSPEESKQIDDIIEIIDLSKK